MNKAITSPVTRILRIHCANRACDATYDYTGPKRTAAAVVADAVDHGWGQHITGQMQCPEHTGGVLVSTAVMDRR